ncbi:hypothetical protein [Streptomyces acidiscabies]|uniref:hypothetical protein n=1 Tax=Streptomyces acidiscabies TaxID=42234 RepID=UPI0038F69729
MAEYTSRAFTDAALAESFNATFKRGTLQGRKTWSSEREARLGRRSPIAYETALGTTSTTLAQAAQPVQDSGARPGQGPSSNTPFFYAEETPERVAFLPVPGRRQP